MGKVSLKSMISIEHVVLILAHLYRAMSPRHHQSAFEYERKNGYGFSVKEEDDDKI